jgi:hypothetical protein
MAVKELTKRKLKKWHDNLLREEQNQSIDRPNLPKEGNGPCQEAPEYSSVSQNQDKISYDNDNEYEYSDNDNEYESDYDYDYGFLDDGIFGDDYCSDYDRNHNDSNNDNDNYYIRPGYPQFPWFRQYDSD